MNDPVRELSTDRLVLEPLTIDHAVEMVDVLGDVELYEFIGGLPPDLGELSERYGAQVAGSRTRDDEWLNWILRLGRSGPAVGFVQATITGSTADVAWVVGVRWQGMGFAVEAASRMIDWLTDRGVNTFTAHIHPDHKASQGVARSLSLENSGEVDEDGEEIWLLPVMHGEG
ncbi:MAG TPA: GNAT family N-acetyltransferase [Acidimicrobiia bacterium]